MTGLRAYSIIHLTDLHLYADPGLTSPEPEARAAARKRFKSKIMRVKRASRLLGFDHLDLCSGVALVALEAELSEIAAEAAAAEDSPTLVVIHTGDAETVGPRRLPNGTVVFDGYNYLHHTLRDSNMGGVLWIDVFGNHDVWGGSWPLFERIAGGDAHSDNFENIREVDGLDSYSASIEIDRPGQFGLIVRRVNTIDPHLVAASMAWGKIESHPIGEDCSQVCSNLLGALQAPHDTSCLKIVAMHHPPHAFEDGWWFKRWWTRNVGPAHLRGKEAFAEAVNGSSHLVLAGHRHKLNPSEEDVSPFQQSPLAEGKTVQLVAASPTASIDLSHFDADSQNAQQSAIEEMRSRSFPTYELVVDEFDVKRVSVWRTLRRLQSDTNSTPNSQPLAARTFSSGSRQLMLDVRLE